MTLILADRVDAGIIFWMPILLNLKFKISEAIVQRCSVKKMFLEISKSSQKKNLRQSLFFNKVAGGRPWHWCFPVNFAKFLLTHFLQNTSGGCFWNFVIIWYAEAFRTRCQSPVMELFAKIVNIVNSQSS